MPSKTLECYEVLKDDILRMRLPADDIINEKTLAEQYGASKTPVREALAMLVQEGYLKKIPRVGYLIRQISNEEFAQLNYLRFTLEKGVVQWIIHRCTEEQIVSLRDYCRETDISYRDFATVNYQFHTAMAKLTGNQYLYEEVQHVFNRMVRSPSQSLYAEIQDNPHLYHLQIVEAMRLRDEEKALELIRHECRRDEAPDSVI